jgi:hypothetical protein
MSEFTGVREIELGEDERPRGKKHGGRFTQRDGRVYGYEVYVNGRRVLTTYTQEIADAVLKNEIRVQG